MKMRMNPTRILSLVLCVIMLASVAVIGTIADDTLTVKLGTVELDTETETAVDGYYTVSVPVEITSNPGIVSVKFTVTLDNADVLYNGNDRTDAAVLKETSANNFTPSVDNVDCTKPVVVYVVDPVVANDTATGKLVTLSYKIPESIEASEINLEVSGIEALDTGSNKLTNNSSVNGKIKLGSTVLYGDVNGDGVVNSLDLDNFVKYMGKVKGYETFANGAAADLNSDGVINSLDLDVFVKHIGKVKGYEKLPYVKP